MGGLDVGDASPLIGRYRCISDSIEPSVFSDPLGQARDIDERYHEYR
jgi:hypothetical protein